MFKDLHVCLEIELVIILPNLHPHSLARNSTMDNEEQVISWGSHLSESWCLGRNLVSPFRVLSNESLKKQQPLVHRVAMSGERWKIHGDLNVLLGQLLVHILHSSPKISQQFGVDVCLVLGPSKEQRKPQS